MPRALIVFLALILPAGLTACSVWEDTVYVTQSAYDATKDVVNPDPEIDLDYSGCDDPSQAKLARLFAPVDTPLGAMVRFLSDQDTYPPADWIEMFFQRYPWVHSLIVVDADGWMLDRIPHDPIKRIDSPLHYEATWRETFLQTVIDHPALGPEFYIGTPWFNGPEFGGLIIASFDPRVLFNFCPAPEELVILQPGGGAWTKSKGLDTAPFMDIPWAEMLEDDVNGELEIGGREYIWLVRYVGHDPYIYLTQTVDADDEGGWLF